MQQPRTSYFDWMQRFSSQQACLEELARHRWPNGFLCPRCGHDQASWLSTRGLHQCARCRHQSSVTAGTLFHHTRIALPKWFAAVYLMSADKGGISALRLSKLIGVSWPTAYRVLRRLRQAMGDRDGVYRLGGLVELDDAFIGGRRPGKRGRGAAGKTPILVGVEHRGPRMGYVTIEAVDSVSRAQVQRFAAHHLTAGEVVRTDALAALRGVARRQRHQPRVTPPQMANEWLPKVHLAISLLKRFLLGTFHGVSPTYLQEYLDEFAFRFNRRFWEAQLPQRLLEAAVSHTPIPMRLKYV